MSKWQQIKALDNEIWQVWDDNVSRTLLPRDVDIWAFSHEQSTEIAQSMKSILNQTEILRAEKFYAAELQNCYLVRHGILRRILSIYLDVNAKSINFETGQHGKPKLPDPDLFFNLSHSQEMVVLAVTKNPIIGIDVEYVKPISDMPLVAKHYFSPNEQKILFGLPENEQLQAFYRCWTRKEAYIKSDGRGLQIPLDSFEVSLKAVSAPQLMRIGEATTVASQWTLHDLPLPETYIGVVLVSGKIGTVRYWQLPSS